MLHWLDPGVVLSVAVVQAEDGVLLVVVVPWPVVVVVPHPLSEDEDGVLLVAVPWPVVVVLPHPLSEDEDDPPPYWLGMATATLHTCQNLLKE